MRLHHNAQAIESESGDGKTVERKDSNFEYKAFNLSMILRTLSSVPTKVYVVIDQNESNDKFDEGSIKDAKFPYEYLFKE